MPEENPNRPPRRPDGAHERPRRPSKKPSLEGMQVVLVQSISCIVVVLLVLAFKLVGGDAFAQLRSQFNESIMSNSILATLAGLLESPDASDAGSLPGTASSMPETGASSEASAPDASGWEQDASGSSEPASSSADSPASDASAGAGASAPSSSTPSGQTPSAQTVRLAPEGAAFAVVKPNRLAAAPLEGGTISSGYGYRQNPTGEGIGFHKGIDIAAPTGTPVRAMYFGVVTETGENASYGKYIRIFHGNGMEILYAHCSEILAEKDAVLRAGETAAKVGATGDVTGAHLHIEVKINGVAFDPSGLLNPERYA